VNLPFITADASGPKHLLLTLTRSKFEQLTTDLVERCRRPFENALQDAKLTPDQLDEVLLVGGATRMPMIQDLVRKLTGKEPNKSVNPDEVVAVGAALQAGILGGEVESLLLLDVTPLSLGVETMGDVMTVLIPRNTTIPTTKTETFSTAADDQSAVDIHVLQGERPMARDNKLLGNFRLDGLPPAPRGIPQIEVTFDIDANGILNVTAKDRATGRQQNVKITATTNLAQGEVDRLVREAQDHEAEDRTRREQAEARNVADNLLYTTEKMLRDLSEKIPAADRGRIDQTIAELREALKTDELSRIRRLTEQLQQASHALSQQIYQQAATGAGPSADGRNSGVQDDVVEGEYHHV
jgi:molecular chaperone DnaK